MHPGPLRTARGLTRRLAQLNPTILRVDVPEPDQIAIVRVELRDEVRCDRDGHHRAMASVARDPVVEPLRLRPFATSRYGASSGSDRQMSRLQR
jgi:hypothetical protein